MRLKVIDFSIHREPVVLGAGNTTISDIPSEWVTKHASN